MSEHTEGRIEAFTQDSFSGWWALREKDGHEIGSGDGGLFEPDARRLAACWNMFPDIDTDVIEVMPTFSEFQQASIEDLSKAFAELNAARALLRELLDDEEIHYEAADKVRAYLDACDKPGAPT